MFGIPLRDERSPSNLNRSIPPPSIPICQGADVNLEPSQATQVRCKHSCIPYPRTIQKITPKIKSHPPFHQQACNEGRSNASGKTGQLVKCTAEIKITMPIEKQRYVPIETGFTFVGLQVNRITGWHGATAVLRQVVGPRGHKNPDSRLSAITKIGHRYPGTVWWYRLVPFRDSSFLWLIGV